jgi:hypothetical protein
MWDFKRVELQSHDYLPELRRFLSLQFIAEIIEMYPMDTTIEKLIG